MYWMSAKIPSDQFLLYAFDGVPDLPRALAAVLAQAADCPELLLRVADAGSWSYPQWVRCSADESAVVVHDGGSWTDCLDAVGALAADQLDPRHRTWRLHVLAGADGIPGAKGLGTVVVLQVSHVLGDGIRSSALAARLFGRAGPIPAAEPRRRGVAALPVLALRASSAHRDLVRDAESGVVAGPAGSWPARRTNDQPVAPIGLRTIVRPRSELPGPTVTVGVLAAVAEALASELGAELDLGAEVPMAKPGARHANNHFGNVSVGLHPQLRFEARAARIGADLADRRQRAAHPAMTAADAAFAATPASLLRWGIAHFDPWVRSPTVGGNTVVSSVNRGAADLAFGDCPVVLTAGYPALSPMMGLTHGVHGIGDAVAVSVHAAASAIPDLDGYVRRLAAALDGPR
jgi:hypothetical protein